MSKTLSDAQLAANRRNALKSTGPTTPEGRARSRLNALKHGILSAQVLVRGRCAAEDPDEFADLHQRFRDELRPVGALEEMLVDQIVTAHWRLRRALTAEAGEIALSVDGGQWRRACEQDSRSLRHEWETSLDVLETMHETAHGNRVLIVWLREIREAVVRDGEVTEPALRKFLGHFGDRSNWLTRELEKLLQRQPEATAAAEVAAWREQRKQAALALLDRELETAQVRLSGCAEQETHEEQARQSAALLPSMETLDKILRYETKLERQIFRAMHQLERLQRMRQGEAIPAPLTVAVTGREAE